MLNECSLSLEQMREERNKYESVYIQFVDSQSYYNEYAFCFYEGDDAKYYDFRIKSKFGDKIISYQVENKFGVLKLLDLITKDKLDDNACTMFFVDRDYDLNTNYENENLFVTPCYSVENFYVKKECLKKILQTEFKLNEIESDFKKCLSDFEQRENDFNNYILEFNSLMYLRRKKSQSNSNYSFGKVKTLNMLIVNVNKIVKTEKYDEIINEIKNTLNFNDDELAQAKQELKDIGDFTINFRGKNQLDFFVEFINQLKSLNKNGGYFKIKHDNVHINITRNRLSELSQYAYTPLILEDFLTKQELKFEKLKNSKE